MCIWQFRLPLRKGANGSMRIEKEIHQVVVVIDVVLGGISRFLPNSVVAGGGTGILL